MPGKIVCDRRRLLNVEPEFAQQFVDSVGRQEALDDDAPVAIEDLQNLFDAGVRGQAGQFSRHRRALQVQRRYIRGHVNR